jgi:hypothetical protein
MMRIVFTAMAAALCIVLDFALNGTAIHFFTIAILPFIMNL